MQPLIKVIDKFDNKKIFLLRSKIIKNINKILSRDQFNLEDLHNYIDYKKINNLRMKLFHFINSKISWEKYLLDICGDDIKNILGEDLLVQNKINLSIQMPNDPTSTLSLHTDCGSGDTPFQINLWIPLTDCFKSNSMFILDQKDTLKYFENTNKIKISEKQILSDKKNFIKMKFGQILLFNPAILHGNLINHTNKTRVSLNVRLKSFFSPDASPKNPDRKFGSYYKILNISDNTKFNLKLLDTKFFNE